jgi:hypothetical protein
MSLPKEYYVTSSSIYVGSCRNIYYQNWLKILHVANTLAYFTSVSMKEREKIFFYTRISKLAGCGIRQPGRNERIFLPKMKIFKFMAVLNYRHQ